jgi:hypothetical protein
MQNEGYNDLAQCLSGRMTQLDEHPPILDFGTIQNDMSLRTNSFPCPIPRSDYVVCRSLTWGAEGSVLAKTDSYDTSGGEHNHPHTHDVLVGSKQRSLRPGDRVLVAWVGDDTVVIDLIS